VHTHALPGIIHRNLMGAMIVESVASFRSQGNPNADYALAVRSMRADSSGAIVTSYG
jgi:hypothetical protein